MKKSLLLVASIMMAATVSAQEAELTQTEKNTAAIHDIKADLGKLGAIKLSGYVQAQWQWTPDGLTYPSGDNAYFINTFGGNFSDQMKNRFMIRRGRIKFTYTKGTISAVIQPDFTEKGVGMKDAYVNYTSKNKALTIRMGLFDRPFGYEIEYSSSQRESAERSRTFLALFPGERDGGAKIQLKGANGFLSMFTLDAGLFNGVGISAEADSYKDFIGKLNWSKNFSNTQLSAAFSYYRGTIFANRKGESNKEFKFEDGAWKSNEVKAGQKFARQYFGYSFRLIQYWGIGTTNIVAELVTGQQPSSANIFANSAGASFNGKNDIYLRQFRGGYAMLVQDIANTKHSVVFKYDSFNPNTKISKAELNDAAVSGAKEADVPYTTYSVGYLYRFNESLRLMAQYDIIKAKKTNIKVIEPSVFTLRAQVKF